MLRYGPALTRLTRMPCGPEVAGEVARHRLERRLGHAHPVVERPRGVVVVEVEPDDRRRPGPSAAARRRSAPSASTPRPAARSTTSSHGASRNPPPRHDSGANASEWTTPSSFPPTLPASAARSSSLVTSSSTICTSGVGRRLAVRSVRRITRPNELSTTSAPCSCATRAVENAIDASLSTPVTRMRLPSSSTVSPFRSSERRVGVAPTGLVARAWCRAAPERVGRTRRVSEAAMTSST